MYLRHTFSILHGGRTAHVTGNLFLLAVILTGRMTPLAALIAVPVVSALIAGFGLQTAVFMVHGIQSVSAVAGMFIFAIVYFGIITDAGMLDPIVDRILAAVGSNPSRIVAGTALLALLVHLGGPGAVTFLVTIPVMLPPLPAAQESRDRTFDGGTLCLRSRLGTFPGFAGFGFGDLPGGTLPIGGFKAAPNHLPADHSLNVDRALATAV